MTRALPTFTRQRLAAAGAGCLLAVGCAPRPASTPPAPASGELVIAATTDVHGWLRAWDYYQAAPDTAKGLARAATIVDSIRAAHPGRVVLVDAGDLLQGTVLTSLAARATGPGTHPVVAAMNAMRYDAAAIGNHEFNYGLPVLDRAVAGARFPFLAANAYRPDGSRAYRAWTMVERAGAKVAIVGATNPGSMVWDRDHLRGRLVVKDIVSEVRTAVAEARRAGADVVIASIHAGLGGPPSYDTLTTGAPPENVTARVAQEVPGLDVVVFGHSHREVADTTINGVLLLQAKNHAASVAAATLQLVREAGGRWRVTSKRGQVIRTAGHAEDPAVVAAVDSAHRGAVAHAATVVATTPVTWRADSARAVDTPLLDFVLEVQRRATGADLAATAAFSLDATIDSGDVTVAEIARLYPYENTLRAIRVTGKQLRAFLEHSARYYRSATEVDPAVPGFNFDVVAGVDYTLDLSRPIGQRVTRLERDGRPVRDDETFTMALNNYRQTGGGGFAMLAGAPVVHDKGEEIRELLIAEARRRGTLRPADYHVRNWRLEGRGPRTPDASRGAASRRTPPAARLRIIATNDFHGTLEPRTESNGAKRGGAAAMASVIERERAACAPPACQSLLLDGGDMYQGSLGSNLVFGRSVVEVYDALGYTAAALGNHEFDWGQDTLRARMRQAKYAILGANVRDVRGRDVPWIRNDTLVRRGPYRVGVIGVATVETPRTTRAVNVRDLRFVDPAPVVDSIARRLRARGADAIVVIAHAGAYCNRSGDGSCDGEIVDLARKVTEQVDAIVSGHTHSLVDAVVNGIPIVQARSNGRAVAVVDLPMGAPRATAAFTQAEQGVVHEVWADSVAPHAGVQAIVRRYQARVEQLAGRRIATIRDAMTRDGEQYALGNLIADAQRRAGGGDVAVMNNGGIRADLRAGPASYGALFEIQPFGNTLHRMTVRGADLRAYFEHIVRVNRPRVHVSGVTIHFDTTRATGSRITRLVMADGRPLDDARTYRLVLNDFLATGGDGLGLAGKALRDEPLGIPDLDALIDHLRQLPQPVAAPTPARLVPTP